MLVAKQRTFPLSASGDSRLRSSFRLSSISFSRAHTNRLITRKLLFPFRLLEAKAIIHCWGPLHSRSILLNFPNSFTGLTPAAMAYQPGDWLAQAAFARGRNETSEVVGRKKCRAHRQRSDSGAPNDGRYSDIDMREMRDSKMGRRRYRRWANDNILRELAPALTAADIGNLFAPPPWGDKSVQSPLEIVMATSRDMAAWEPFRNVDMDFQAKVLQQGLHKKAVGEGRQNPAMKAWCGVERNLRSALRRNYASSFLQDLEEKLVCFIEGDGQDLVLAVGSTYDRLLVHGSSQFHGLKSLTVEVPVDSSGSEVETCILIRKTENSIALNLPGFLKKIKHKESAAAA